MDYKRKMRVRNFRLIKNCGVVSGFKDNIPKRKVIGDSTTENYDVV